ncbi:MAG: hypothetical protein IJ737_07500 [Ruminococcus sp.]|nr:hypothetical protein [Ruminococcus sp.]
MIQNRMTAVCCAVVIGCTVFVSCGKNNDKKKDSSSAGLKEGQHYCDYLEEVVNSKDYAIGLVFSQDGGEMTVLTERSGEDLHSSVTMDGTTADVYYVDGKAYTVSNENKAYLESSRSDVLFTTDALGLDSGLKYLSTEERDGLNADIYESDNEGKVVYYYDDSLIFKKLDIDENDEMMRLEVTNFQAGGVKIELPDLSDYTFIE